MIRFIFSLILLINIAYANGERYFIKLGSFKNLQGLEKSINRMPYKLRSHVVIVDSNSWYIPFAYYVKNKSILYPHVKKFKRYFPDAHINHSSLMLTYPVVRNYSKRKRQRNIVKRVNYIPIQETFIESSAPVSYQNVAISSYDNTFNTPVKVYSKTPLQSLPTPAVKKSLKDVTNTDSFTKKMLSGNNYYLAYKSTKDSPNLLIKVIFKNHKVVYQPVIGNMKMTNANYLIEDKRLYMFSTTFTKDGAYSTLDKQRKNYFLVSSWVNGKKMNTLRYYYKLNDAKEYLGFETSNGLANVLESGSYDDYFLDD